MNTIKKTALITGASKGLGRALAEALAIRGWNLIINARNAKALLQTQKHLEQFTEVVAISGDVRDEIHLLQFPENLARKNWKLNLIVNNASTIGASPQPYLMDYKNETIHNIFHTNVIAPLSLLHKVQSQLSENPTIVNISSDAAVEAYEGWGGYSASKAALDHLSTILGKENPTWKVIAIDPGEMRTDLYQAAVPHEDISDKPSPNDFAVPAIIRLLEDDLGSGRYVASEVCASMVS